jgi:hypothetical protein
MPCHASATRTYIIWTMLYIIFWKFFHYCHDTDLACLQVIKKETLSRRFLISASQKIYMGPNEVDAPANIFLSSFLSGGGAKSLNKNVLEGTF